MKIHLFSNDKSTAKDELVLTLVLIITAIIGVLLIVFRPHISIIKSETSAMIGAMMVIVVIVLSPIIIYRLMENNYEHKNSNTGESKNE